MTIHKDKELNAKDPSFKKLIKWCKIVAAGLSATAAIYAAAGPLYTVPRDVKDTSVKVEKIESVVSKTVEEVKDHSKAIQSNNEKLVKNSTDIDGLKSASNEQKNSIDRLQRSVDEVNVKQGTIQSQSTEINKNLIELNTSFKYLKESLDDLKRDSRK